jgi:hypothetical protein
VLADKMQIFIPHQRAGQKSGFAQNLKTVADTENEFSLRRKFFDRLHHGRKTRQRTGSQIIAVGKTARNDDGVITAQIRFLVPHKINRLTDVL